MAVSKRLRYEVMRRDGFRCRYCGFSASETELQVDHVQPIALGGGDEPENLVTSCADCNAGKSASSPDQAIVESVADDSLRWAKALEEAAAIKAAERAKQTRYTKAIDKAWSAWTNGADEPLPRPRDWKQSLEQFRNSGLDQKTALHMVDVTMNRQGLLNNKAWKYFCGCCWNVIREQQAIAAALIERDEAGQE